MNTAAIIASAFGIGFCTGLRCMTPVCVIALMRVPVQGISATLLFWPFHQIVFPLMAVGELIGDKLPQCPSRLEPLGIIARIVFGAFCGTALATVFGASIFAASVAGMLGAVIGAVLGNRYRMTIGKKAPIPAALAEDVVAIAGSILIARMFV